jgi:hypothetical protein
MIAITQDEGQLIEALSVAGGWDHDDAAGLRRKIKDYFLAFGVPCCCYCRLSMSSWHRMTIDVEHVLPKQSYPEFTFDPRNLNISCKRCNMEIKGTDISFYLGLPNEPNFFRSDLYSFVHPNLDNTDEHLQILSVQVGINLLIFYYKPTPKGLFTYEYFELNELEINSFTAAQGVTVATPTDNLPTEFAQQLRTVLQSIEEQ